MSDQDNDFDFENKKKEEFPGAADHQKVDNQHYDEAMDLDSNQGSEIESAEEDRADMERQEQADKQKAEKEAGFSDQGSEYQGKNQVFTNAYNPADFSDLSVSEEVKELFTYIQRYKPVTLDLDSKLKPFVPDFFPAIGEVDAFLKMDRPDKQDENLGIKVLDEPSLNMSKQAVIEQILRDTVTKGGGNVNTSIKVHSIPNADKNPKAIQSWINDVAKLRENKPQPTVPYSKQMPDIDNLMQVWPQEIEDVLAQINLPSEELDITTEEYARLLCSLIDIPVHPSNQDKNVIEALHVAFTLYTELKANQHLQQNNQEY